MKDFIYEYGDGLYLNLTNDCPMCCTFCVRNQTDSLGNAECLWLDHDPSAEEVVAELEQLDLSKYKEVVFCGYGEPTCQTEVLTKVADYLKEKTKLPVRLNTNGLGNLLYDVPIMPFLMGRIDAISISLNAPNAERYIELCNPVFGEEAYASMLKFAESAVRVIPDVTLTVVDVLSPEEIEACRKIATDMGAKFRVRPCL